MTIPNASYFAVVREAGPAWAAGKGLSEQPAVGDHAAFMNSLADDGFLLVGGPLGDEARPHFSALLIVSADTEADIRGRLAADPWATSGQLLTVSVDPWTPLVGAGHLSA